MTDDHREPGTDDHEPVLYYHERCFTCADFKGWIGEAGGRVGQPVVLLDDAVVASRPEGYDHDGWEGPSGADRLAVGHDDIDAFLGDRLGEDYDSPLDGE